MSRSLKDIEAAAKLSRADKIPDGYVPYKGGTFGFKVPVHKWKWCFNGDWFSLSVFSESKPPNRIKRFFMKYFLNVYVEIL